MKIDEANKGKIRLFNRNYIRIKQTNWDKYNPNHLKIKLMVEGYGLCAFCYKEEEKDWPPNMRGADEKKKTNKK